MTYDRTAAVYDLLYQGLGKDYAAESLEVRDLIRARTHGARTLLDVGCGTGGHLRHLAKWYDTTGIDLAPPMLAVAATHLPGTPLVEADMRSFDLDQRFDAVVCLFSAIGHLSTVEDLNAAVATMARHLSPGGVLIVDGWILPERWRTTVGTEIDVAEDETTKVARVWHTKRLGDMTYLAAHHLIATAEGVDYVVDEHELRLFAREDYEGAFEKAGLAVETTASPMPSRDRYVGWRDH